LNKARGNEYYLKAEDLAIEAQTIAQKVLGLNAGKPKFGIVDKVGEETPEPTLSIDEIIDLKQDETEVSEPPASVESGKVLPDEEISIPEKVEPIKQPSNKKDEQTPASDSKIKEKTGVQSNKTAETVNVDVIFPPKVKKSKQASSDLILPEITTKSQTRTDAADIGFDDYVKTDSERFFHYDTFKGKFDYQGKEPPVKLKNAPDLDAFIAPALDNRGNVIKGQYVIGDGLSGMVFTNPASAKDAVAQAEEIVKRPDFQRN
jgi:hypothetical protein